MSRQNEFRRRAADAERLALRTTGLTRQAFLDVAEIWRSRAIRLEFRDADPEQGATASGRELRGRSQ